MVAFLTVHLSGLHVYGESMSHVKDKSKNEILEAMVGTAMPTSPAHEQQKAGIIVRCTEEILNNQ